MAVPLGALDPADGVGVGGGAQLAAGDAAEVIGDDVMVADAAVFVVNAVEELDEFDGLDVEAGFLADLAHDACDERLADFEHAAGEGPVAFEGLAAAADEQDAALVDDDGADADEGREGNSRSTLHCIFGYSSMFFRDRRAARATAVPYALNAANAFRMGHTPRRSRARSGEIARHGTIIK